MKHTNITWLAVGVAGSALVLTGCGSSGNTDSSSSLDRLEIIVPSSPGGGFDQTARAIQGVLEKENLVAQVQVTNNPDGGGMAAVSEMTGAAGEPGKIMVVGLALVSALAANGADAAVSDYTPIAKLTGDAEVIVVPKDSPFESMDDLIAAWQEDPRGTAIAGGAAGGADQVLTGLLAQEVGIEAKDLNYIAYSGGGEATAALLGNKVDAGISGVSEFRGQIESGDLRALAVSTGERVEGLDVPTLQESGTDVEFANWRAVVGPPDMNDDDVADLTEALEGVHEAEAWTELRDTNGWTDEFSTGDDFATFLSAEEPRITEVLTDLGLVQ